MAALQYVDVPGYNAILIRDTYANLSKPDSLIPVSHEWLKPTDAYWKGTDRIWQFPSGATLSFGHLDDPTSHFDYQSAQFQFVGIDEMVAIRENQAMYMFSRLRRIKGKDCPIRFRGASNPPTREQLARGEWVKTRYVDDETREPGVIFLPAWMEDNPHLDIEEYDKSLDKLDTVTRKQLKEGDWNIQAKGKIFEREWFKMIDVVPVDVISTIRYWDFAATAKTDNNNQPIEYACFIHLFLLKDYFCSVMIIVVSIKFVDLAVSLIQEDHFDIFEIRLSVSTHLASTEYVFLTGRPSH